MRQAGVIAAAGIVALETMIDRLTEDHENARLLANGINQIRGLKVDVRKVETNMVYVDHRPAGLSTDEILARFKKAGVIASGRPPTHVRLVTNRHHSREVIEEALRRIRRAMET